MEDLFDEKLLEAIRLAEALQDGQSEEKEPEVKHRHIGNNYRYLILIHLINQALRFYSYLDHLCSGIIPGYCIHHASPLRCIWRNILAHCQIFIIYKTAVLHMG